MNVRHPSVLEKEINAVNVLATFGNAKHNTWIIRKKNAGWHDVLGLNLQEDFAEILYVRDANDALHAYVKTHVGVTAREMVQTFPGFNMKVASSPCDLCKLREKGEIRRGHYPSFKEEEEETLEEWLNEPLDDFFN